MGSYCETSVRISPRLATMEGLAAYFGMTISQFDKYHERCQKKGMPQPITLLGLYDLKAIDLWLDRISGISSEGKYNFRPSEMHTTDYKAEAPSHPMHSDDPRDAYTVAECISEYLDWFRTYRKSIKDAANRMNATVLPAFGHMRVIDLTVKQIRDWHASIATSAKHIHVGLGRTREISGPPITAEEIRKRQATANHDLGLFKAALNRAFKEGKVKSDMGWRMATQFRMGQVSKLECLSAEQCQRLMFYLPEDFQQLVRGVLFTGARFTEISSVTAGDFDADRATIYFPPGKSGRSRYVVLSQEGKEFFDSVTGALHRTDLIFRRYDGQQWGNRECARYMQSACRLAGFKYVTFHTLRHTYATALVMSGVPIAAVARNLGHASTKICQRFYFHLTESYVSEAMRTSAPTMNLPGQLDQAVLDACNGQDKFLIFQSGQQLAKLKIKAWPRKKLLERAKKLNIAGRHRMHRDVLEMLVQKDIDDNWSDYSRGKRFATKKT